MSLISEYFALPEKGSAVRVSEIQLRGESSNQMATGAERQAKYFGKLKQARVEVGVLRRRIAELEAAKAQPTAKSQLASVRVRGVRHDRYRGV